MEVKARIASLRNWMTERGIAACLIPSADYHQSEYVGAYFKTRQFFSGFTGSAGTLVVMQDAAGLWTDGRYFLQAERELEGSGIDLFRLRAEGVPDWEDWLAEQMPENSVLGFDGRTVSRKTAKLLKEKLEKKDISFHWSEDPAESIWTDRPQMSANPVWVLKDEYAGKTVVEKLADLREATKAKKADFHVLSSLDDIAWLFNLRGSDVAHCPVFLSHAVIDETSATLFARDGAVGTDASAALEKAGVHLEAYGQASARLAALPADSAVLLDPARISHAIFGSLPEAVHVVEDDNPTVRMKAVKNDVEIAHLRECHVQDGVAFVKFLRWLKSAVGRETVTEISAADHLAERRMERPGFVDLSFGTIAAYQEHAAMMHYSATTETSSELRQEGLFLVDSGGQYLNGTTDITRTIVLGAISEEQRLHFTTVLRSMLNLAMARFPEGVRGVSLDVLARGPVWDLDLDYRCGTGHGVGFLLNVHEGPNNFFWDAGRSIGARLEAGMVTTDEPGIYCDGSHGIRTENELLCARGAKTEYGQFLHFEPLTMAPIDLGGIDARLMQPREIDALNAYHALVFEKLSPHLTEEETDWLKTQTRPLERLTW